MIDKMAGYKTQVRQLEKQLKELNPSKKNDASKMKEVTELLKNLKDIIKEKEDKREQRKKDKETKAQETSKEEVTVEAVVEPVASQEKAAAPTCALCGGVTFPNYQTYQQHLLQSHPKPSTRDYKPMDNQVKKDVVKNVEKNLGPAIISEKKDDASLEKFSADDVVVPSRGEESIGQVLRHDSPKALCYVLWQSGPLKDKHVAGGYYMEDLKKKEEKVAEGNPPLPDTSIVPKEEHCPCWDDVSAYCPQCKSNKTSDLKSNYMDMLKDLKEEHKEAMDKHDHVWVARLEFKIKEMEEKIAEKFGNKKEADGLFNCENCHAPMSALEQSHLENLPNGDQKWNCNKKEGGAQNAEQLTIVDHLPPRANKTMDEGGTDGTDEFQDLWAGPAGTEKEASYGDKRDHKKIEIFVDGTYKATTTWANTCQEAKEKYLAEHKDLKPEQVKCQFKTASLKKASISIEVFNKSWTATPTTKEGKLSYEVSDNTGKRILSLSPINGQEMNAEHLKWAIQRELTSNFKQAKLTEKVAMLPKGSKVYITASDRDGKRLKFVSMAEGVRGWISASKVAFIDKKASYLKHKDHMDAAYGNNGKEVLVDCPNGSGNMVWLPMGEFTAISQPLATPESLNDLESAKKDKGNYCWECDRQFKSMEDFNNHSCVKNNEKSLKEHKQSSKDCPDCHGNFVGSEGQACPTCGRFAVIALKTAIPQSVTDQDAYLNNPPVDKQATDAEDYGSDNDEPDEEDVFIQSEGQLGAETVAYQGGKQIAKLNDNWEAFYSQIKNWMEANSYFPSVWIIDDHGGNTLDSGFHEWMNKNHLKTSSLNKVAIIVEENGKFCVRSPKNKKWNGGCYKSRAAAEKRLKEVEVFKHMKGASIRPFSKKAEVLSDPYSVLTTHINDMKSRMTQVQERLQSNPLPKQAGEEDNSMDLSTLLEDLSMGLNLLETKFQNDSENSDLASSVEELENLLMEVETKSGIKEEHKDVVNEMPVNSEKKEASQEHSHFHKCPECGDKFDTSHCSGSDHEVYCPKCEETGLKFKEAATTSGTVTTTVTSPSLVTPAAPTNTTPQTDDAPSNAPDDASPSCALCGGLTFADYAGYQNHMEYTHKSETMPTSPSQKLDPTTASKKKVSDVVTDETITEETNDPNAIITDPTLTPIVPPITNVMPTDDDNLEVPVQKPSSPPSPGQIWVFNSDPAVMKYVSMPDGSQPGKTI